MVSTTAAWSLGRGLAFGRVLAAGEAGVPAADLAALGADLQRPEVQELLRSAATLFVLVSGPGSEQIPDTMFFARRLEEAGYRLGPVVVNRVHPRVDAPPGTAKRDPAPSSPDETRPATASASDPMTVAAADGS